MTAEACERLGGFEDFDGKKPTATPHPCDVLQDKTRLAEARGTTKVLVEVSDGSCFWIDKTETNVKQYEDWLESHPGFSQWDSTYCSWKTSTSDPSRDGQDTCRVTIPPKEDDPWNPSKPIRCVDWCDAEAFCRTTGGRLCDSYASGYEPVGQTDRWGIACTSGSTSKYPWGDEDCGDCCNRAVGPICPNGWGGKCEPGPVDKWDSCDSNSGVANLLGNVREWVFSCKAVADDADPKAECRALGGSFADSYKTASCSEHGVDLPRDTRDGLTGFRCCEELSDKDQLTVDGQ